MVQKSFPAKAIQIVIKTMNALVDNVFQLEISQDYQPFLKATSILVAATKIVQMIMHVLTNHV